MEREKMIEEMEAILEQEQIKIANTVEEFAKLQKVGITRCNAEALYNANCRIVSEGAVVLTKEELETTDKIPQKIKDFYKWFIEIEKEQARKETAEKILSDLYFNLQSSVQGKVTRSNDYYNVDGWIKEIAEEYGVEVE